MSEEKSELIETYVTRAFQAHGKIRAIPMKVTIPSQIVKRFKIKHGDLVIWVVRKDEVVVRFRKPEKKG